MALENIVEETPSLIGQGPVVDSNLVTVPVEQVQSFDTGLQPGELQQLYGTSAMPAFQFARLVQTGERTFDPTRQFDKEAAEVIAATPDSELQEMGIDMSTKDLLTSGIGFAGGAVISKAGQLASVPGAAGFVDQIGPAAKSFLPSAVTGAPKSGLTVSGMNPTLAKDFGLSANQSAITMADFQTLQAANPAFVGQQVAGAPNFIKVSTPSLEAVNAVAAQQSGSVVTPVASQADTGIFGGDMFKGYTPGIAQVGATFGLDLAIGLFSGKSPKQAIKDSAITTAGTAIGTAVGGPIGGFIGGTIAKVIGGGSVICTELHAQGKISDSEYRTTNFYNATMLTSTHIKGYYFWGVPVAEKIRAGKGVKFWEWIYRQWLKHARYKLGKTKKFSASGFVVAKSLETISLIAGKIYESTTEKRIFANG